MNVTTVYELFSVIMQETFQHNNDFSITYKTNLCRFTQMHVGNLIIVSKAIHALIHATNEDVINLHKHCIKDKGMLEKLNTLRILANNKPITI